MRWPVIDSFKKLKFKHGKFIMALETRPENNLTFELVQCQLLEQYDKKASQNIAHLWIAQENRTGRWQIS